MSTKHILLVDDSVLLLDIARAALEVAGFRVTTANDLGELEAQQAGPAFDLILMDVEMPELYGDDVAAILRHVRGVRTPVYLFSNLPAEDLAVRSSEAGVDGFIWKREGMEAMVSRVRSILGEPS